jgi:hypothetical protein
MVQIIEVQITFGQFHIIGTYINFVIFIYYCQKLSGAPFGDGQGVCSHTLRTKYIFGL